MIFTFSAGTAAVTAAADDGTPSRTISGVAVPWNVDRPVSSGHVVRFLPGSLPVDGAAPKFLRDHQVDRPLGLVVGREDTGTEMRFEARISATRDGDEALVLAGDGVLDAVSVGVEPVVFHQDGNVLVVELAEWHELSLLPFGAFQEARVERVAAQSPTPTTTNPEEFLMSDTPAPVAEAAPVVPTSPIIVAGPRRLPTAAEWISAAATGKTSILEAAAAEMVTDDTPGLLPEPIVGAVYNNITDRRPLVSAIGTLSMPAAGEIFNRRRITQHSEVDVQSAQFDELASQAMTVSKIPVTKVTVGGYVDLSEQEVDWTDPAAVALVLGDLGTVYARRTEQIACSTLTTGATETEEITDWTDGDEVLDALYDASATIAGAIDELPTHLFVSVDRWATLGKMKQANGDRLFPAIGPSNAGGTMNPATYNNVLGLSVVVSNQFTAGTMIIGNPRGLELYEQRKGSIRVDQPATLSVRLAFRGYFASLVIDETAFVALVDPA